MNRLKKFEKQCHEWYDRKMFLGEPLTPPTHLRQALYKQVILRHSKESVLRHIVAITECVIGTEDKVRDELCAWDYDTTI